LLSVLSILAAQLVQVMPVMGSSTWAAGNLAARTLHTGHQVGDIQLLGVEAHHRLLGGEVDVRLPNAVEFFKAALDIGGTIDAGHAS
jgi:hypothetical protein